MGEEPGSSLALTTRTLVFRRSRTPGWVSPRIRIGAPSPRADPSARWADGSAMFITVTSRTTINCAMATTLRTSQRRSSRVARTDGKLDTLSPRIAASIGYVLKGTNPRREFASGTSLVLSSADQLAGRAALKWLKSVVGFKSRQLHHDATHPLHRDPKPSASLKILRSMYLPSGATSHRSPQTKWQNRSTTRGGAPTSTPETTAANVRDFDGKRLTSPGSGREVANDLEEMQLARVAKAWLPALPGG